MLSFSRSRDTPILVPGLVGKRVVHIAAGSGHSAAVSEDGVLYTWGKGTYGRLGHGECAPIPPLAYVMSVAAFDFYI